MLQLNKVHHIAIICSDYERSKTFYTEVLGFTIHAEIYRAARDSWKLDLALNGNYLIELFSFPDPPPRVSSPEARGKRRWPLCWRKEWCLNPCASMSSPAKNSLSLRTRTACRWSCMKGEPILPAAQNSKSA
jgi:hypothetical protein